MGLNTAGGFLPILWDCAAYEKSLERLQSMSIGTLLCSHPYRGIHLPPALIRRGQEAKEYIADSLLVARKLGEIMRRQVSECQGRPLVEIVDRVIAELPPEWGFKPLAELPMPDFSLGTVAFAVAQWGEQGVRKEQKKQAASR